MVRPATLDDLPAIVNLASESPTSAQWSREQYQSILSPSRFALVVEENQILGFLVAHVIGPEWELENIVIANSARRRGLGLQLLQSLIRTAGSRAASFIFLEVRESNLPARRLYEKHGFQASGMRPSYYRNPSEAAIIYRLGL